MKNPFLLAFPRFVLPSRRITFYRGSSRRVRASFQIPSTVNNSGRMPDLEECRS
jgi:hypothetical protein